MGSELKSDHVDLLIELYSHEKQEVRDLFKSMDLTVQYAVALLAIIVAAAVQTKEVRMLFLIPSVLFMFSCLHFTKVASANVHGLRCKTLANRIRMATGDELFAQWGKFEQPSRPLGPVQFGFDIFYASVAVVFASVAVLAFFTKGWDWSFWVHAPEFGVAAIYGYFAIGAGRHPASIAFEKPASLGEQPGSESR